MMINQWTELTASEQQGLLQRPGKIAQQAQYQQVQGIIDNVKSQGDSALFAYAQTFEQAQLATLQVSATEFEFARRQVGPETLSALEFAIAQIKKYHQAQLPQAISVSSCKGIQCEREARAIEAVGLYIPGGSAPLVSTVLMLAIPAQLAGCARRVMCTPCNAEGLVNANVLVAAQLCGITEVYKVGGAQAIAAMAYGTQSILKVNKIFGPGNSWVTAAKVLVAQDPNAASIDMPAGPSELLIIADQNANANFVAADLLSQAEHGPDSQVILIANDLSLIERVQAEIQQQTLTAPRKAIIEQALECARFIFVDDLDTAIEISNQYAPEHLILNVVQPEKYKNKIINAAAVFLGAYTPETMGDYVNGSNHVLPTSGCARSMSGLSVLDFMKFISFQTVSLEGLKKAGPYAEQLASIEGLFAHKNAVSLRLKGI